MLGRIVGKSSTNEFSFLAEKEARKFSYVQAKHQEGYNVLAQVVEVEKQNTETRAKCNILGYRTDKLLQCLKVPLEPNTEINDADDMFIQNTLGLGPSKYGAYVGTLEGRRNIKVFLDLNKLLTKHVAVLAKSGSGKSYCVGVVLEEIMERNVPIVVIDPHGEYSTLKLPNPDSKDELAEFGVKPKGYEKQLQEFSPDVKKNPTARPLKLSSKNLTPDELMKLLPTKLSGAQMGILYSAIKDLGGSVDFDTLIKSLEAEEGNAKWNLINVIYYLKQLDIFSDIPTSVHDLVVPAKCSIINLRGIPPNVQEVIVYKIVSDLFNARKHGEVPPFFLVVEESHNFCPERSFGEAKSSQILRNLASEGRKFGLGLCAVTQRPARLDKNVLAQCTTQIILKLTNPNDLKMVGNSVEGITAETEKEIRNINIGTAMIVGIVDMPLFVDIRPRKTKHGGEAVNILETFSDIGKDTKTDVLNIILPKYTEQEIKKMITKPLKSFKTILLPCSLVSCNKHGLQFSLLVNLTSAEVVSDFERGTGKSLIQNLGGLSQAEEKVLKAGLDLSREFNAADIFGKSGLQFSEIYDVLNSLAKKNYFIKNNEKYKVSNALDFFTNLDKMACFEKCEYKGMKFDEKLDVRYDIKEITNFLKKFFDIEGFKQTWLVKYDVEYSPLIP